MYIIACETLRPELTAVMREQGRPYPAAWIPAEKHSRTDLLRECIQSAVDAVPVPYTAVLLAFGFCGNSLAGIQARNQTLVLPRTADCIPLFLGSQSARNAYGPGTYFFTEGHLRSKNSLLSDLSRCVQKYGPEDGTALAQELLKHYTAFAVIDTGASNAQSIAEEIKPYADLVRLPVSTIPGNIRLLRELLAGNWNNQDFLVIPPGKTISLEDTFS
ncbi:MAG: DUF1638 domain-containing protein [Spirochaetaceae bacterium]|jgi:hypothetical protein|nr:DUF1638 domain-containing protein [Spirochaetaceae bacterium]